MNIETKLADNFGAAYDALDAAKKAYDNARKAVIQHGKPVLVGTSYTIELGLKETPDVYRRQPESRGLQSHRD